MTIKEVEAKSILRKHKKIDSWFLSCCGMNLYRGCTHNCVYCDGRSEGYYVEGEFGEDISVKINAAELVKHELDPRRRRKPLKPGYIIVGGGVGDSYQPAEEKYRLTRSILKIIADYHLPVHMLTKSALIERDIDILKKINDEARVIVSVSFSSVDDDHSRFFEPGVPLPGARLKMIERFKREGIACGMFLLPVIPFITDTNKHIDNAIQKAKDAGVDFVIFGCMTLKEGKQKDHFMAELDKIYPDMRSRYKSVYKSSRWGEPEREYINTLNKMFGAIAEKHHMPVRIPDHLFKDILDIDDRIIVLLEHIDYLLRLLGKTSSFGYAAYAVSRLNKPLTSMKGNLKQIGGVRGDVEAVILELLSTGRSSYYEKLLSRYK